MLSKCILLQGMSPLLSYQTMSPLYKVLRFFDILQQEREREREREQIYTNKLSVTPHNKSELTSDYVF